MTLPNRSTVFRLASVATALAGAATIALFLRGNPAQAQGPMSAPACQCSVPTPIPGMASRIAHCLCGAMSCAITETSDSTRGASQMQCVRL
jgi:hypothetical protein